jgi:hypothetical protein
MKRTASAMLCIDWSAMTERVSTVADWGVSRAACPSSVAVRDVVAAYPARRVRSAVTRTLASSRARVRLASESGGTAGIGDRPPLLLRSCWRRDRRENPCSENGGRRTNEGIGSIFVWITDMTSGKTHFAPPTRAYVIDRV